MNNLLVLARLPQGCAVRAGEERWPPAPAPEGKGLWGRGAQGGRGGWCGGRTLEQHCVWNFLHLPGCHRLNRNFSGFPQVPMAAATPLRVTAWGLALPRIYPSQVPAPESPPTCSWGRESSRGVLGNSPVCQGLRWPRAREHPERTRRERTEDSPPCVSQTPSASPRCCPALHLPAVVTRGPGSLLGLGDTLLHPTGWICLESNLPPHLPARKFCPTSFLPNQLPPFHPDSAPEEIPWETSL